LEKALGDQHEVRSVALGHIQRGGETCAYDRVLSIRYGVEAANLISRGEFGNMVCIKDGKISKVSLEKVIGFNKQVDPEGELVKAARALGVSFGDREVNLNYNY